MMLMTMVKIIEVVMMMVMMDDDGDDDVMVVDAVDHGHPEMDVE